MCETDEKVLDFVFTTTEIYERDTNLWRMCIWYDSQEYRTAVSGARPHCSSNILATPQ